MAHIKKYAQTTCHINYHFCIDLCVVFCVIFIAKAASVLQSRLLGDKNEWTSAVMTWSRLQGELADRRTTVNTPSTALGGRWKREEGRRSEQQGEEEEKCDVETRKSTEEQREEESGNGRQRSGEQNGAPTPVKKRKRDDEEAEGREVAAFDSSSEINEEDEKTSERERRREGEEEREAVMEFSSCRKRGKHGAISGTDFSGGDHAATGQDHTVEISRNRRMDDLPKDFAVENVENGNKIIIPSGFISSCITSTFKVNISVSLFPSIFSM